MTHADDWPHTGRLLPWMVATFITVIWLVPVVAVKLSIPLPVDPTPDRLLLFGLILVALVCLLADRRNMRNVPAAGISLALLAFASVALLSLALNAEMLASLGDLQGGIQQFAILVSVVAVFFVTATVIRPSELRNFGVLIVFLAMIAALGTIYEYRSGTNVFYDLADGLFGGIASVAPTPTSSLDGRASTFGPTNHPLAIATLLTLALPFAVIELTSARSLAVRALYGLGVALIITGAFCTQRKTAIIAPAVVLLVMTVYRPRMMLPLLPFGALLMVMIHLVAPGAITGVTSQVFGGGLLGSESSMGRTSDYDAVKPDIASHPALGRGFGTMDPSRSPDRYRILDNQYLGWVLQTGVVGLGAYLALLAATMALAHRLIRYGRTAAHRRIGLASMAAFAGFAVASAIFDLISFVQVPYMFCIVAGMCSVAAAHGLPAMSLQLPRAAPAK